jgi:hypothetical protein
MTPAQAELLNDALNKRLAQVGLEITNYKPLLDLPSGRKDWSGRDWLVRYKARLADAQKVFQEHFATQLHEADCTLLGVNPEDRTNPYVNKNP